MKPQNQLHTAMKSSSIPRLQWENSAVCRDSLLLTVTFSRWIFLLIVFSFENVILTWMHVCAVFENEFYMFITTFPLFTLNIDAVTNSMYIVKFTLFTSSSAQSITLTFNMNLHFLVAE
jgi:hypothetical protein